MVITSESVCKLHGENYKVQYIRLDFKLRIVCKLCIMERKKGKNPKLKIVSKDYTAYPI